MIIVYGFPIFLSSAMIAAHFYRDGQVFIALFCLFSPFILLLTRSWVPKLITVLLVLFALEWLRTMLFFIDQYKLQEISYSRLVMILSSVIVFTLSSSAIFKTSAMRKRYQKCDDNHISFIR